MLDSVNTNIFKVIVWNVFRNNRFAEMTGRQHLISVFFKLLLQPWDLSEHVERQKLMVIRWEEVTVRVRKKVVLWLTYLYIMAFVPMLYLKLGDHIYFGGELKEVIKTPPRRTLL